MMMMGVSSKFESHGRVPTKPPSYVLANTKDVCDRDASSRLGCGVSKQLFNLNKEVCYCNGHKKCYCFIHWGIFHSPISLTYDTCLLSFIRGKSKFWRRNKHTTPLVSWQISMR